MKTINIAGSIKELMIFDDPEYCHDDKAECPRMGDNYESASCCFFLDKDNDPVIYIMIGMQSYSKSFHNAKRHIKRQKH